MPEAQIMAPPLGLPTIAAEALSRSFPIASLSPFKVLILASSVDSDTYKYIFLDAAAPGSFDKASAAFIKLPSYAFNDDNDWRSL